jgi:hypothetical protein
LVKEITRRLSWEYKQRHDKRGVTYGSSFWFLNKPNAMNITVPTDINEIKLEDYIRFEQGNKEDADSEFIVHRLINLFCGVRMRDAMKIPLQEAEEIAEEIAEVLQQDKPLQRTFEFKGVKYGMIPSLSDISLGEYVDLEEFLKDTKTLNKAMAVLYRPITKQYKDIYDIEAYEGTGDRADLFKEMPLGIATAATLFFYNLSNELLRAFPLYSLTEKERQIVTTQQKDNSQVSTAGSLASIVFLKETLQNLMK